MSVKIIYGRQIAAECDKADKESTAFAEGVPLGLIGKKKNIFTLQYDQGVMYQICHGS